MFTCKIIGKKPLSLNSSLPLQQNDWTWSVYSFLLASLSFSHFIGKSVVFYWSVYGNVVVGPTFEDSATRGRPLSDAGTIRRLVKLGESCVPGLAGCPIVDTYTGVRPATETKDYHIDSYPERCGSQRLSFVRNFTLYILHTYVIPSIYWDIFLFWI